MSPRRKHYNQIMGIAPCGRGFGYCVLEALSLVEWGVKSVFGDKNAESVDGVTDLVLSYKPEVMILEDTGAEGSRRAPRIRELTQALLAFAIQQNLPVAFFRREQVKLFFVGEDGTKRDIAVEIAKRYPEELGDRVPPERRPWMSQDYRVDLFDAVALALMFAEQQAKTEAVPH